MQEKKMIEYKYGIYYMTKGKSKYEYLEIFSTFEDKEVAAHYKLGKYVKEFTIFDIKLLGKKELA